MSTPKQRHSRIVGPLGYQPMPEGLIASPNDLWEPLPGFPGYLISADGRVARLVKIRVGKKGARHVRVSKDGVQHWVRL